MSATNTPSAPVLTRHADAETCSDPSSVMTLLADSDAGAGGFTSYRSTFAKGAVGAPAHFHTRASELFFVIGGSLRVPTLIRGPGIPAGSWYAMRAI